MDGWLPSDLAARGVCFYTVQYITRGGGGVHMKRLGMLIRKFELNP